MISPPDIAILGAVALLLFGPEQLPKIARRVGGVMRDVQNTSQSFIREMERAADLSEEQERAEKAAAAPGATPVPDFARSEFALATSPPDFPAPENDVPPVDHHAAARPDILHDGPLPPGLEHEPVQETLLPNAVYPHEPVQPTIFDPPAGLKPG